MRPVPIHLEQLEDRITPSGPTLSTLVTFNGTNGTSPYAGLLRDSGGNLYGTTEFGGAFSAGTVFRLSPDGTFTTLHNFNGNGNDGGDGSVPVGGLIMDRSGNLYGTTGAGGAFFAGTVFRLSPDGTFTTLHNFNRSDGNSPHGYLLMDSGGNLYGTTESGGPSNIGVVYRLSPDGTFTDLVDFNGSNGSSPVDGLVMDSSGNLYGTMIGGGLYNDGGIFRISPNGTYTIVFSFDPSNGGVPDSGRLLMDSSGNLYGTTGQGGAFNAGTVFRFSPDGTLTTLHSFNSSDGSDPYSGVIMDSSGNLYGATTGGGASGDGTVFQLSPDGTLTTLVNFNGQDGRSPFSANLVLDGSGNLYGTTTAGGGPLDDGTVFEVVITPPSPSVTGMNPTSATEGDSSFTLTVNGSNFVNPSTVQWNGTSLTTTFVSATQLQAVVPAADVAEEGSAAITVVNANGTSNAQTFTINDAALTGSSGAMAGGTEGLALSSVLSGATFSDANPGDHSADMTALISWGDGGPATAGSVSYAGGSYTVSAAHTYAEEGNYPISITVTDAGGQTATVTGTATVADAPLSPAGTPQTYSAVERAGTGPQVLAQFSDPGTDGTTADYTATISWGDGTSGPGVVSLVSGATFQVVGSHTYGEEGSYPVSVTVTDSGGAAPLTVSSTTFSVADAALSPAGAPQTYNAVEGAGTGTQVLAQFTDPGTDGTTDDYTATITWGDDSTSPGTVSLVSGTTFAVSGGHVYSEEGSYPVSVTITDAGGAAPLIVNSTTFSVTDAPLSPAGAAQTYPAVEGAGTGPQVLAQFTDPGTDGTTADYTATISWGDGTTAGGDVSLVSGSTFQVTGAHTYSEEGSYPVSVTITDSGGAPPLVVNNTTFSVADAALTGSSGATAGGREGVANSSVLSGATFSDANPGDHSADMTALISWGDGATSAGSVSYAGGSYTVSAAHTYAAGGGYPISVAVTDAGGQTATVTGTATVAGPPTASLSGPAGGVLYQSLTFTFGATDPIPADQAGDFTYAVNWGDGNGDTVAGPSSATDTHTYTSAGTFTVTLTATDQDGVVSPAVSQTVVIAATPQLQNGTLAIPGTAGPATITLTPTLPTGAGAYSMKVTRTVGTTTTNLGTFAVPTGIIAIYGGPGPDAVTLNGTANSDAFAVGGGAVSEQVAQGTAATTAFSVVLNAVTSLTLKGAGGSDSLTGPDQANAWAVTGANAGTLDGSTSFTGIEGLTGGAGGDTFSFAAGGSVSGLIDGGAGPNALDFSARTSAVTVTLVAGGTNKATGTGGWANVATVVGSAAATDTLVGANTTNVWDVTGGNAGTLNGTLAFSGFENLTGGSVNDTFAFLPGGSISGNLKGGAPVNTLDYSAYGSPVTVSLAAGTATGIGGTWGNINVIRGTGTTDTLIGPNANSTWSITGADAGTVGSTTFSGFANLTGGGTGNNVFQFGAGAAVSGTIVGGGGTNTLNYSSYTTGVYVDLQTLSATGTSGVANIQNVTGSAVGGDILVGDVHNNVLTENAGQNLVIGGGGGDTLTGGSGGDILIAGSTIYDQNTAALDALLAVWGNTALGYNARVAALLTGVSYTDSTGTHTATLDAGSTVSQPAGSAPSTIKGGSGLDWFFAAVTDIIKDRTKGEIVSTL